MKKKVVRYAIYAIVLFVFVALLLAFCFKKSGVDACSLSLDACFLKNKVSHGAIGKFFADIGCVWNNMICVIKSLF